MTDLDAGTSVTGGAEAPTTGRDEGLIIIDPASVPSDPPAGSFYRHHVTVLPAIRATWNRREILWALAERDVRSGYKQQVLGMAWSVINPIISILVLTLVFSHVKSLHVKGVPYVIYAFTGMMCWTYFGGSFSNGGSAMTGSINLLQKTHFPRECFPLAQMLEQVLYTTIAFIPLTILMVVHHYVPHIQGLWIPVFLPTELLFTAGMVLAMASCLVYVRDLSQLMGLILQFGLFASPVIWPLKDLAKITWGPFHNVDLRPYYVVFNPLGAVIDNVRRTLLQGQSPEWFLLGLATASVLVYFFLGYRIFKRLETGFADIS